MRVSSSVRGPISAGWSRLWIALGCCALACLSGGLFAAALAEDPARAAEGTAAADTTKAPAMTGWKKAADLGLNFNQSSYSDSWAGKENAAISWAWIANLEAERQLSPTFNWKNTLKLSFGQTHQESRAKSAQGAVERRWMSPEKSSDRIFFESLLRASLGLLVDPFAGLTFESQFYDPADSLVADGPDVTVARMIHPILLTESVGVGRTLSKAEHRELYSRLGFAVRQRLERGVVTYRPEKLESHTTTDGGLEWVTDFTQTFGGGDLKYVSKLRVFEALFNSAKDDVDVAGTPAEDYWKTPDVGWENALSASVAKYVQVSLFFELLYDKEIDLRGRFREILGLGLSYKLF